MIRRRISQTQHLIDKVMATKLFFLAVALFCAAAAAPQAPGSRITGGTPVTIQEFPYVTALLYYYPGPQIYIQRCVGAIISSWHLLSTSFCFTGAELSNMYVRAGSTHSLQGGLLVTVREVAQHPDYVANPRQNDLAVLTLESPLPISSTIDALYLPAPGTYIPDNANLRVVSWGFETASGPQHPYLKSVYLDNINMAQCGAIYSGISNVVIGDSVLCAGRPGNFGTCFGDSGAPVVINNVLVGISSVYHECGTDEYPDVFTRVDRFTNWILEVAQAPNRSGVPIRVA